ncbi:MAG TPA: hypothetical protein VK427_07450, partial [Kofleriaceae bacterium]|nr:hypothetical protein [Kofleriaceae bacterium]
SRRIARVAVACAVLAAALLGVAISSRLRDPAPAKPNVFASPRVDRGATAKPKPATPPAPDPVPPVAKLLPDLPSPAAPLDDQDGKLVDDERAQEMLRALERDAQRELDRYRARRSRRGP